MKATGVRVNDGGEAALAIFQNHYTYRDWRNREKKNGKRIAGPGERILLLSKDQKASFYLAERKVQNGQTNRRELCSVQK